jgi:hypothetical protein
MAEDAGLGQLGEADRKVAFGVGIIRAPARPSRLASSAGVDAAAEDEPVTERVRSGKFRWETTEETAAEAATELRCRRTRQGENEDDGCNNSPFHFEVRARER